MLHIILINEKQSRSSDLLILKQYLTSEYEPKINEFVKFF